MKQIEDVVDEGIALAGLERRLQPGETGNALVGLDHDLAVDQRRARRELGDRRRDIGEFARPLETLPRQQAHLAIIEPGLDAVAVELDLVHPACTLGRGRAQGGERRRHEVRQRGTVRPGLLLLALPLPLRRLLTGCAAARAARALLRARW